MEAAAFEALAQKVELAVSRIESLKQERDGLLTDLNGAREQLESVTARAAGLEGELSGKDAEIESLRNELNQRSENLTQAGDRVRELVSRLDAVLV
jgi:chromosome segregation ATPase